MSTIARTEPRRQRADAARNRRRLLDAAVEVFGERGLEATVSEIAQRAGVGQGTAFRHFPTKEQLIAATVRDCQDRMTAIATELLQEPDAAVALREFMRAGAQLRADNRGFIEAAASMALFADPGMHACHERLLDVACTLLRRAQDQGAIRADVTAEDIPLLLGAIGYAAAPLQERDSRLWERYFELVFDALRPEGATPLSVPAPTRAQLEALKSVAVRRPAGQASTGQ